jgi:3-hydroxyacyl-CoA dehydrogenase
MAPDRPEGVWGEIERLRDWRHDRAEPILSAVAALMEAMPELASLGGRLTAAEARLTKLEPEVERMARADMIADAVTSNLRQRRGQLFSRTEKLIAAIVGLGTVASIVLQLLGH